MPINQPTTTTRSNHRIDDISLLITIYVLIIYILILYSSVHFLDLVIFKMFNNTNELKIRMELFKS